MLYNKEDINLALIKYQEKNYKHTKRTNKILKYFYKEK